MQPALPEIDGPEAAKKRSILIVEDEPLISLDLEDLLVEMGYEVCSIETTEAAAVAAARRYKPDLMLVDFHLREGSGINVVSALLPDGFIPHIYMSGERLRGDKLTPGAVVLQKPFLEASLAQAIQVALSNRPKTI